MGEPSQVDVLYNVISTVSVRNRLERRALVLYKQGDECCEIIVQKISYVSLLVKLLDQDGRSIDIRDSRNVTCKTNSTQDHP